MRAVLSTRPQVFPVDLNEAAELAQVESLLRTDRSVSLLVNHADFDPLPPPASGANRMSDMIALNVTALTRLTCTADRGFLERGAGTIIVLIKDQRRRLTN